MMIVQLREGKEKKKKQKKKKRRYRHLDLEITSLAGGRERSSIDSEMRRFAGLVNERAPSSET